MKQRFFERIGQWITPPCIRKCLTSLKALTLLLVMGLSVNVWGATKITTLAGITSGGQYYIGATVSSTDYYFKADVSTAANEVSGTSTTDKTEAVVATITKTTGGYSIQVGEGLYLSLASSKANGKVNIVSSTCDWTFTESSNLINMKINGYCLMKNSSTSLNFGSYSSGQTNVWLEAATSAEPYTVTLKDDNTKLEEASAGAGVTLPTRTTTCEDYAFAGWSETNCATETTTAPTIIEAGNYKPSKNIELYPVFKRVVSGGEGTATSSNLGASVTSAQTLETGKPITYTVSATNDFSNPLRVYKNSTLTIAGGTITKIVLSGNDAYYPISNLTLTSGGGSLSDGIWTKEGGATSVVFKASVAQARVSTITVTYSGGSTTYYVATPTCSSATLTGISVTGTPETFWKGDAFNHNGITVTANYDDETTQDVTNTADYSGYDMSTSGNQTVTVTYKGKTATYDIVIKTIANTKETAYTVAQAIAIVDANPAELATQDIYVKGIVTSASAIGTYGNSNIDVKDPETDGSAFVQFFRCLDLGNKNFTEDYVGVGDTVIALGKALYYSQGKKYELNQGCYLVEYKKFTAQKVDISNTPETAYTPAKAIELYNDPTSDLTKAVYVKGVVTTKPSMTTGGTWQGSYYQVEVAAAETETPTFVFFHMFAGAESAKFEKDIVNAKDTLIAYGTLTKYNSTYELAERCYMYERKAYVPKVTGVTIDNKEGLTVPANESITLTATIAEAGAEGTLVWSVIAGSDKASVDAATGVVTGSAAGDATIQVQVQGTEFTDNCTVTVTAAYEGATLPYSFDGGKDSEDPAFSQTGLGSDYSSSPKLKFDTQADEVVFHIAEAPAYMSFDIKGNGSPWKGQFDVLESADNETYTSVASYTELESSTTSLNVLLTGTSRYIKFVYTTKTSGNVALGNIKILATAPKVDPTFSIANVDVTVDGNAELQITTNSDGAVTYTIDPDNSGIEITDGTVYAHAAGTYTVTANKAATETYNAAQTTFTVTVSSVAYKTAEVSTFTAVNGGLLELGQFHSYKGDAGTAPAINNNHIRLYQNGGYITISALPGLKIAKIDISTAQSTLYNYKVDAAEDYTLTEAASLAKDATANLAGLIADSVRIYCLGTDKNSRFDVSYLKVYYTGELETVSALAVDGATKTEYEIGETVNHSGAVVTATFENAGAVDVTLNSTFTDPDMSTSGTKQVTAKFAEQTATYDITVKAETPEITVDATFVAFGTVLKDAETAAKTVAVTLTAITNATVAVTGEGKDAFNVTPTSLTESGNITITPVTTAAGEFAATITISADGAESKTIALSMTVSDGDLDKETVDFTEVYSDVTGSSSVEFAGYNGITFSLAVAKNDGTQPKYYANGSAVRAYAKNTITISSSKTIAFVLIEHTGKSYQDTEATVDKGTLKVNDAYSMWTLDATSGTITLANTIRFDKITVYYKYDEAIRTGLRIGQVGTICQGKNILAVKGVVLYNVEFGTTQEITLKEITEFPIAAGTPAIFQAEAVDFEVIYGSQTATEAVVDGYDGLVGLLQGEVQGDRELIEEGNILVSGGKLRLVGADCYLTAGHAYIEMDEVSETAPTSPAPGRRLVLTNDEAQVVTGLNALQVSGKTRKMMMNNQMVIIREGKMYNATGALMK